MVLEKPIGHDLASARKINDEVGAVFSEAQIFRIDHYLGKETVQNLLALRFANTIFERLWNADVIDHVQITVAETVGVEGRGGYYDHSGALRDMVQNHLLQLLCLIAMEPPVSLEADRVRDEKLKVLRALRPIEPHEAGTLTVRGQYAAGAVDGKPVPGYVADLGDRRAEPDRDLRRAEGGGAHLALGERAVLPAHRQAPAAEGVGDRACSSARCRSRSSRPDAADWQPNRLIIRLQPRGGDAARDDDEGAWAGRLAAAPDRARHQFREDLRDPLSRMPMSGC